MATAATATPCRRSPIVAGLRRNGSSRRLVLSAASVSAARAPAKKELPTPAPTPPASKGLDRESVTARLLDIVCKRTGYPAEMLGLDMDLEADLGIDSIKRVEFLARWPITTADRRSMWRWRS